MKEKVLVLLLCLAAVFSSCGNKKTSEKTQASDTLSNAHPTDCKMMIIAKVGGNNHSKNNEGSICR